MDSLLTISVTVIAVVMVGAVICLIPVLLQIRRTAREAEKVLETVRSQIPPVSRELTHISGQVTTILQSVHRQIDNVEDGLSAARDAADHLRDFEEDVLQRFKPPLFQLATVLNGVSRGVGTFFRVLLR